MAEDLGAPYEVPDGWAELFQRKGPNDQTRPDQNTSKYPSKEILITELEKQHNRVKAILISVDESKLGARVI